MNIENNNKTNTKQTKTTRATNPLWCSSSNSNKPNKYISTNSNILETYLHGGHVKLISMNVTEKGLQSRTIQKNRFDSKKNPK